MNTKEMDAYFEDLSEKYKNGTMEIVLNKDRAHNAMVMRLMLDTSCHVCMYCGEMSVFRIPFYNYISEANKSADGDADLGKYLKEKVAASMYAFLAKENAKLQIIVQNSKKDEWPDKIIFNDVFKQAISDGKVEISLIDQSMIFKDELSHFAFSDKIIRMEKDLNEHSAICAVNPPAEWVTDLNKHFATLRKMSNPFPVK